MTKELKQKIAQMFIVGFQGETFNSDIENLIKEYYFSNFILFTRNVNNYEQLKSLCSDLKLSTANHCGTSPLIAIDEEGGQVSRLKNIIGEYPSCYNIGLLDDENTAYKLAYFVGKNLKNIGINMNLAPVVDINSNPENPVIGIRSFGDNKDIVCKMSAKVRHGYEDNGIISVIKHFPGHGDTNVDSHKDLPTINITKKVLEERELSTFKYNIEDGASAIMISHVVVSAIDETYPSTLSEKIVNRLLRKGLNFDGLVVSDCFEMSAIKDNYCIEDSVVRSILAGVDIIDISHTQELQIRAIEAVYKAVEEGVISIDRIDETHKRIEKVKKIITEKQKTEINCDTIDIKDIYKKCISKTISEPILFDDKTIIIGAKPESSSDAEDEIINNIDIANYLGEKFNCKHFSYSHKLTKEELNCLKSDISKYDFNKIVLCSYNCDINKIQYELFNHFKGKEIHLIDIKLKAKNLPFPPKQHIILGGYTNVAVKTLAELLAT